MYVYGALGAHMHTFKQTDTFLGGLIGMYDGIYKIRHPMALLHPVSVYEICEWNM